ncbi:hypothetical protein K100096D8_28630 [Eggerthella lenta]
MRASRAQGEAAGAAGAADARRGRGSEEAPPPREAGRYAIKALSEPPPPPVKGARGAVRPCAAASVSAIAAPPSASRQMIPWRSITRDARIAVNPRIAERGVSPWEGGRGAVGGSSLASRNILRLRA